MAIAFPTIPAPFLPPLYYADIIPGPAPYSASLRALVFSIYTRRGLRGSGAVNTPYILSGTLADQLAGPGSMLSSMFQAFRKNAPFAEVWGMMLPVQVGGTSATGSITVTGTPTVSGPLYLRIAGRAFSVATRAGDATATLASRIAAQINALQNLPVTAAINIGNSARVDLTAKWEGGSGNYILVERSFWGQSNPIAVYISVTAMSGGTGSFDSSAALAQLNKQRFDVFAGPLRGGLGA